MVFFFGARFSFFQKKLTRVNELEHITVSVAIGYTGLFFSGMGQFYLVQNIRINEKITFVWVFVPISATAKGKTKMATYFRPIIGFWSTDPKLLVWQKAVIT